jgi:hypothetical protein
MIALETSKRNKIDNEQATELSALEKNYARKVAAEHPHATKRTNPSPLYNCHGLAFASRRTRITDAAALSTILADDQYEEVVSVADILQGDLVVYYDETGDPNHSGVVVEILGDVRVPRVCSKWGSAGEFVHNLMDCPSAYGPKWKFYKCLL